MIRGRFTYARRALLALAFVASPSLASASTLADLSSSPQDFNGERLTVQGSVANLHQTPGLQGKAYALFSLCAGACIRVYADGNPRIKNGDAVTVNGTFAMVEHMNGQVFYNVIESSELNIRSASSLPVR